MIGVVMWTDKSQRTAIVWCEDQGDLAFIDTHEQANGLPHGFDAGELIQFDLMESPDCRIVRNPRRIGQQDRIDVSKVLDAAVAAGCAPSAPISDFKPVKAPLGAGASAAQTVVDLQEHRERMRSVA